MLVSLNLSNEKYSEMSPFHVIIPARYQSSRLPGKPLMEIAGKTMIEHVVNRAKVSKAKTVIVATDDARIKETVENFGGEAVMTSTDHQSGSDRIAEVVKIIGLNDESIIVNVQGDEPDIPPTLINQVVELLEEKSQAVMSTTCAPLENSQQLNDPSVVKVVTNQAGYAIYFSRATIPWVRQEDSSGLADIAVDVVRRHLGIYAYRSSYIQQFAARSPCELERQEKLEQLRAMWHGEKIACAKATEVPGPGVDSEADLLRVRELWG